ncbi:MAG: hypothetical protein KatS3mg011_0877 [Acidimicrobiia bacterium]|nr:MAG: hypothetical protein KatS3mg011_0877 [Acidimicrobiia bacterium]
MEQLPEASRRLVAEAARRGVVLDVRVFPEGTKTAVDAARAVGCPVGAIVKSLVFVVSGGDDRRRPVVALLPGDRRLEPVLLAEAAGGDRAERATLEEVREATGFAAGGTPPFGHRRPLDVYADPALRRHDPVWAAGGTPTTVFPVTLQELDLLARPVWTPLSREP